MTGTLHRWDEEREPLAVICLDCGTPLVPMPSPPRYEMRLYEFRTRKTCPVTPEDRTAKMAQRTADEFDRRHRPWIPGEPQAPDLRHQLQEYTDTTAAYEAGEDVIPGDCWRACLASLLEVPIGVVPHFIHLYPTIPESEASPEELRHLEQFGARWWQESIAWVELARPGWTIRAWEPTFPFPTREWQQQQRERWQDGVDPRVIVTGKSPRGDWNHSVIVSAWDGALVHDPFPGGEGVDSRLDMVTLVRGDLL